MALAPPQRFVTDVDLPVDALPFTGVRLAASREDSTPPPPAPVFLSLRHWFEAEKFRNCEPEIFGRVLIQPTLKEVIKLAKRERSRWRMDWEMVRCRALACGMVYASSADLGSRRWQATAEDLAAVLAPLKLPERFNLQAANEFIRLRQGPEIAFLGAEKAPRELVGKKINALHRRYGGAWQLLHWCGRHTSWPIHHWAVAQLVPVRYLGSDEERLSESAAMRLSKEADVVVVFERKGGKSMDKILRTLRSQRACAVELELYDPGNTAAELVDAR